MKKFLVVSWSFPPVILPRSLQVSRTIKSLRDFGWQASVLTVDPGSIQRTFKTDPVLGAEYEGLFPISAIPSAEDWLVVRALWRLCPSLSLMPDPRVVWIPGAVAAGRRILSTGGFSGILSFAQPWSDHIIGRQLARDFGLPWIAHFSDPWSDSPYYKLRGLFARIQKIMEQAVIRDADAVIFVSDETRSLVMKKYPQEWSTKSFVIPHCYERLSLDPDIQASTRDTLRMVYTGGFYGHRTPVNLFKSIAMINQESKLSGRLEVTLAGSGVDKFAGLIPELNLEGIVKILPAMPYHESLQLAGHSDALLVIDAPSEDVSVFLPSKLVEYLAFRKPILGITSLQGSSANLLRELECPIADSEDVEGIATALREMLLRKRDGTLHISDAYEKTAARYDVHETSRQYDSILSSLFNMNSGNPS